MKFKVELGKGETIEDAEKVLEKALNTKRECSHGEQYCDPALNEFHELVEARHKKLVEQILQDIKNEIDRDVYSKGHI